MSSCRAGGATIFLAVVLVGCQRIDEDEDSEPPLPPREPVGVTLTVEFGSSSWFQADLVVRDDLGRRTTVARAIGVELPRKP